MRAKRFSLYPGILIGALVVACGAAPPELDARVLREATVLLVPGHCAGVVVEDGRHVMTAAHCVAGNPQSIELELHGGERLSGTSVFIDRSRDVALFRLDAVAPITALPLAPQLPQPGEGLLFAGRYDPPGELQEVWLERLGRCPSLPGVPQALFTTLHGEKGDSGAPVVDRQLRVVGLVHGGATCSIATPTAAFAPLVQQLAAELSSTEVARRDLARGR
ncbi:serine protease [Hyalangium sp.]|uniref:S1 family peptidase n=1 Tax=Hyalangium sp. TaxID=2028555 RepID=UPI002D31D454|nr:serine protease [Hyalangium sp.]HYI01947.1 serine protease [Hyalangium sp.]